MAQGIFKPTFDKIDTTLATYINDVATNVIAAITPVVTTLLLIYVTLWGWSVITGKTGELVTDGFNRIIKITIIVAIAINLGYYNSFVVSFLSNLPDRLAELASITVTTDSGSYLDGVFSQIWDLGWKILTKAKAEGNYVMADIPLTLAALAVWLFGFALTVVGAFLLVLSKMALSVLLGVGPIFVLMLLFEPTKRFFESWLGQCFNFILIVMLVGGILRLIVSILTEYLTKYEAASAGGATVDISGALPAVVLSAIAILIMRQVMPIASALGGGIALNTMNFGRSIPDKFNQWDQARMQKRAYNDKAVTSGQQIRESWKTAKKVTAKMRRGNNVSKS
ncbi:MULTISPECIES: type IV secretion system protein [Methylophaga]|uniref:Type IV secretion protein AvhB6 n=1 Tax=Methylophaga thalassica TaxID=40223 RepID=A0ABQ5TY93_9GAMM|nr:MULTISPECIES: type IV secretion system protein [Methylophaga]AUZ86143.1 conjugal transfer protein [Methylophaga nitratireducenticrescens]GLQ00598.1 type IV secretion protein AvhB6 [Methylophaga thalassica]